MKAVFLSILLALSLLRGESLTLNNNSNYTLTAEVYNALGEKVGSVRIPAGSIYMWYSNESPFITQYDQPYTPYTVRWLCTNTRPYNYNPPPKNKNQKPPGEYLTEFGSWEQVPPGAMVTALGSTSGNKTCVIQKKPPRKQPKQPPSRKPNKNEGFNNFSNDGGKSWSNDSGDLPDEDEGKGHFEDLPP